MCHVFQLTFLIQLVLLFLQYGGNHDSEKVKYTFSETSEYHTEAGNEKENRKGGSHLLVFFEGLH